MSEQRISGSEDEKERLNRKLIELLNELRVALPGVQVLFAFLLALPFTQRFEDITDLQRNVFFASFLATAAASALLIAPSAYHRIRWRHPQREEIDDKARMLRTSSKLAAGGIVFLGIAVTGVIFLITDLLFGLVQAIALSLGMAGVFVWFWYLLPIRRRIDEEGAKR